MARKDQRMVELSYGMPAIIKESGKLVYISDRSTSMKLRGNVSSLLIQRWLLLKGFVLRVGGDMDLGNSMAEDNKGKETLY